MSLRELIRTHEHLAMAWALAPDESELERAIDDALDLSEAEILKARK